MLAPSRRERIAPVEGIPTAIEESARRAAGTRLPWPARDGWFILVEGARQNNLKGVSVRVPVGAVTAVTGVAGAGKSSLAFDVLHAEGYRTVLYCPWTSSVTATAARHGGECPVASFEPLWRFAAGARPS